MRQVQTRSYGGVPANQIVGGNRARRLVVSVHATHNQNALPTFDDTPAGKTAAIQLLAWSPLMIKTVRPNCLCSCGNWVQIEDEGGRTRGSPFVRLAWARACATVHRYPETTRTCREPVRAGEVTQVRERTRSSLDHRVVRVLLVRCACAAATWRRGTGVTGGISSR